MIVGGGAMKMAFSVFAKAAVTRSANDELTQAEKYMVAGLKEVD